MMFLLLFSIIDLYLLIPAVTAQTFIPTAELVMSIGMLTEETKSETDIFFISLFYFLYL